MRNHLFHEELFTSQAWAAHAGPRQAEFMTRFRRVDNDGEPRFVPLADRQPDSRPCSPTSFQRCGRLGAGLHYKGLLTIKSPFDMCLYPMLLWELRPRTIVELGSFQGGSGVWLADQLQAICGAGRVMSFDADPQLRSERAVHPLLEFHHADLEQLDSLDPSVLADAPHPWLVIDDAHVNVVDVFEFIDRLLLPGDYYVLEDVLAVGSRYTHESPQLCQQLVGVVERLGYMVDTYYTDNFGYNMTAAPNGWWRKMEPRSST